MNGLGLFAAVFWGAVGAFLLTDSASAWRGMGGPWGPCSGMQRAQALTELKQQTIAGTIKEIQIVENCMGDRSAKQLKVVSGEHEYFVHLGPSDIVNNNAYPFAVGDEVKISGATYANNSGQFLVASELEVRGTKYVLRDKSGRPVWAVGRQSGRGNRGMGRATR